MQQQSTGSSQAKVKGVADIVFCIDATQSMEPCIDGVKKNIETFISNLKTDSQTPVIWRAKIIGYRDCKLTDYPAFEGLDNKLGDDVSELKNQLDSLKALGGGDMNESTLDVIYKVIKSTDWKPLGEAHRFIIVFTDAPPIPEMDPGTVEPGEPRDAQNVKNLLFMQKIQLHLFSPEDPVYKELSSVPKAMHYKHSKDDLANADFNDILSSLAKTVSKASVGVVAKGASTAIQ